jgi:hypothetical protein
VGKYVYVRNKKTKAHQPGWWSDQKRIEVLTTFLATGSQKYTSAITGVPEPTITQWRKSEWWGERTKDLQLEDNIKLDSKLSKVMDKALDAVIDRIDNGEYMYDPRTGEIKRIPAKLRDVQKVAGDMIDKKQLLAKMNRSKEDSKQQITADHLVLLAKEFAKFASGKEQPEYKDVKTVIEGEHQEVFEELGMEASRDYGLQEKEGDESPQEEVEHEEEPYVDSSPAFFNPAGSSTDGSN